MVKQLLKWVIAIIAVFQCPVDQYYDSWVLASGRKINDPLATQKPILLCQPRDSLFLSLLSSSL